VGSPFANPQVAAVTYKLRGEKIKAALLMNPGKIILCPRQSGKSISLAGYMMENYPDGAIVFTINERTAKEFNRMLSKEYFKKSIIVYGPQNPPFFMDENLPIFADEFFGLIGVVQKAIVRDRRFTGAVGSVMGGAIIEEVRNRCIPY